MARLAFKNCGVPADAVIGRQGNGFGIAMATLDVFRATEAAQRVIDAAVQLHGGGGVRSGHIIAAFYREFRALRIYEGASDVQKMVIARAHFADQGG